MLFRFFLYKYFKIRNYYTICLSVWKIYLKYSQQRKKDSKNASRNIFFLRKHLYCMLSFLPVQILVFESRTYLKVKAQKLKHENLGWGP